jgi:hypothetical protein
LEFSLPEKSRRDIALANTIYSVVGPLHSPDQTVNLKTASAALDTWLKASGRFRLTLGEKTSAKKLEKAEIIARFWGRQRAIRLGKMPPLCFFQYVLDCAISAALTAQDEVFERKLNPDLKGDLWLAWVRLVILAVEEAGIRASASSQSKGTKSPFIEAILYLQKHLPEHCSRRKGYESVAKGVQLAKRKLGQHDATALRAIIAGWGTNILGDYDPNNVQVIVDNLMSSHLRSAPKK